MLSIREQSDIAVRKTDFDTQIYHIVYERECSGKKYVSSTELAVLLNEKKVVIVNKKNRVVHKNFYMMYEVI